jgi:phenylacetate-coenzyme A ligase PaaK-like adenylate-forming protein
MWGERIYGLLPTALQNAAVSVQGGQFQAVRYLSASFRETARRLERNEHLSLPALEEVQFAAIRELATHCFGNSPFYRRLWESHGVHPDDIRTPSDVRRIPIVTKEDLRARTEEFFTQKTRRGMTVVHTSGTTGSPVTVCFSKQDIGRRYAFLERCRRWAGVRIGQRRATFTGRNIIARGQSEAPFWRYNFPGKQMLFSSYHLSPANLPAYVEALQRFQPEIIDGYPSAIHILADHILRRGSVQKVRPQAILVSAETVFPHQREAIEAAFQTKLYNQYASSEGAPFISECTHGRLHVHMDSGLVEILDAEGNPAIPGQVGQMVVSSFTTQVVPLLRFAIGDTAIPSEPEDQCPCGLPFPTIDALVGRVDDLLCTPDRGFVGRLDTVFKGVPNSIVEAQIVQTSAETIILRLVPDRSRYCPEHARQIVQQMRSRLGEVVAIQVEEVRGIPRSANGKMRSVINLCGGLLPCALRYDKLQI